MSRRPTVGQKLDALKRGVELPVDPCLLHKPGTYLDTDEKAVHELSVALERAQDPDYVCVSWANQVLAAEYFNTYGLERTLDKLFELEANHDRKRVGNVKERP